MNRYSQNKFLELSNERQVRILLDLIYKTESVWEESEKKSENLSLLQNYFQWMDLFNHESPMLNRLASFQFKMDENLSLRALLDLAVPLERYLNLSIKDEHLVRVKEGDKKEKQKETYPLFYVLDHLRSAFNVGSLFRTADCLGVEHIYLVGYTPTPDDSGVKKTAMGTEKWVSWSQHNHLDEVIALLKEKQVELVALETTESALPLDQFEVPKKLALLVGNERFGLSYSALSEVSKSVEIPMRGIKNSLNVANTLSIATFEVIRQWMK